MDERIRRYIGLSKEQIDAATAETQKNIEAAEEMYAVLAKHGKITPELTETMEHIRALGRLSRKVLSIELDTDKK